MNAAPELVLDHDFNSSEWLNPYEAAIYLRKFKKDGSPCAGSIRNLVCQGKLPFYKPFGRLLFNKSELRSFILKTKGG